MIVGVVAETKPDEYRVGLLPVGVRLLREDGHRVVLQAAAGQGSGISDEEYADAGAEIVPNAAAVFRDAELIVKVKEPQPDELKLLGPQHVVFGYFHFAGSRDLTTACLQAGVTAIAYETLRDTAGRLPLLTPMSEVAGRLAVQSAAKYLERPMQGRGVLLGGVPGVERGQVLVIGAGVVGSNAARLAAGLGADVVLMDNNLERLRQLDQVMPANVRTAFSDPDAIARHLREADAVIGAVLVPGRRAPQLIRRHHLSTMKAGAVLVDVCIDQGGCAETSKPTTHSQPTYVVDGVVHYCVANMPGAVGRTSTLALCNATLPYVRRLAALGPSDFCRAESGQQAALNLYQGALCQPELADAFPDLPVQLSPLRS